MLHLVGNPEDRFSRIAAQIVYGFGGTERQRKAVCSVTASFNLFQATMVQED